MKKKSPEELFNWYLDYVKKQISKLKKNRDWSLKNFVKLDTLPSIIWALQNWLSLLNTPGKMTELLNLSKQIHEFKKNLKYDYPLMKEKAYQRKFGEWTEKTIDKADYADNAIFRLLQFRGIDCLSYYPIRLRVLKAQAEDDQKFFSKLGNAIKNRKTYPVKIKKDNLFLRDFCIHAKFNGLDFSNTKEFNDFYESLFDGFIERIAQYEEISEEKRTKRQKKALRCLNSMYRILQGKEYFRKWLRRQGVK